MNNMSLMGIKNLCYIFGVLTLVLEVIVFFEFDKYLNGPYWALAGSVIWLLFLVASVLLIVGANLKKITDLKNN